jgi:hypothetical protein
VIIMHEQLQARWTEIGDKIVQLAREFPEDKYDIAPAGGSRTFAEQLRHLAFWNDYTCGTLRNENPDGSANEIPHSAAPTKDRVIETVDRSFKGVTNQLQRMNGNTDASAVDTVMSFIEHNGEHYGQLVLYCRLNGIVPPASR